MGLPDRIASRSHCGARWAACLLALLFVLAAAPSSFAQDLTIAPSRDGTVGAWLAAGPFFGEPRALVPGSESQPAWSAVAGVSPRDGKQSFRLATSPDGQFDVRALLRTGSNALALFGARLLVAQPSKLLLVLGVDDGVAVFVDRRELYVRDEVRPSLHDDDAVAFDLEPGEHELLVRLRQYDGPWRFRARLLDRTDLLPARHVAFTLPGTSKDDPASVAAGMLRVELDLDLSALAYRPTARIRLAGGMPASLDLPVRVDASITNGTRSRTLYSVSLGAVGPTARGVFDLVARLPEIPASDLGDDELGGTLTFTVSAGKHSVSIDRPLVRDARLTIGRIDSALHERLPHVRASLADPDVVEATLQLARGRLIRFLSTGDRDVAATAAESHQIDAFLAPLEAGDDPLRVLRGPARLAYRSPLDDQVHPFGLYVPPSYSPSAARKYPLVVVLHGLDGLPMQMLGIFFGQDDPAHLAPHEDRHLGKLPPLEAFVIAPSGFGNLSYREAGEVDVTSLRAWALRTLPVAPDQVYITGLSMGGTGTAHVALRHPDDYAAAAPLCGYHSYALRRDMSGRVLRPWEKSLADFWSTVSWADNGSTLPLYVVHGKKDQPVKNSGVLIDRYKALGYPIVDEHPDVGHNVWQMTYEGFKAYRWLQRYRRDRSPSRVELKTSSLRYADHDWVHVLELSNHLAWGRVSARVVSPWRVELTTSGIEALRLDPTAPLIDGTKAVLVRVDGQDLSFEAGQPLELHRNGAWTRGRRPAREVVSKRKGLSGPLSDVFLEPLVFVYGTRDPASTRLNRDVASALAAPRFGVEARWPVVADVDVDDAMAASHALFLVGSARTNSYLNAIESRLPVHVEGNAVVVGERTFTGDQLGVMFIYPNPLQPQRYVVVLEGVDGPGLLRGLSLPKLLPDFVVWDANVAGARGQMVLGSARVLAGGFFDGSWRLPSEIDDPVGAKRQR